MGCCPPRRPRPTLQGSLAAMQAMLANLRAEAYAAGWRAGYAQGRVDERAGR